MAKAPHLPNAPLTEVIFELRWALEEGEGILPPFRQDPGYTVLTHAFRDSAKRAGFPVVKDLSPGIPPMAYSVGLRFYQSPERAFPIWQIGPGIFAANQSADYEWAKFKKLVLKGVSHLLKTYPKMKTFRLRPLKFELRYIDNFAKELVKTLEFPKFISKVTTWSVEVPKFFVNNKSIGTIRSGRVVYAFPVRNMKNTTVSFDFGSGKKDERSTFRLDTKFVTQGEPIFSSTREDIFLRRLGSWLESAHGFTSPFFASFIRPEILEKFK